MKFFQFLISVEIPSSVCISVARLWYPRVSPRHNHKFHGGGVFHEVRKQIGHPWWLLIRGRSDR